MPLRCVTPHADVRSICQDNPTERIRIDREGDVCSGVLLGCRGNVQAAGGGDGDARRLYRRHGPEPTYRQVCAHRTGHAEAVEVTFDPALISYDDLLDAFWSGHNPGNQEPPGPEHRQPIPLGHLHPFAGSGSGGPGDAGAAGGAASLAAEDDCDADRARGPFYEAEDYHQRYFEKSGRAQCTAALEESGSDELSPNGLPSESRQIDQRSPGWTTLPPSSVTRSERGRHVGDAEVGQREAVARARPPLVEAERGPGVVGLQPRTLASGARERARDRAALPRSASRSRRSSAGNSIRSTVTA